MKPIPTIFFPYIFSSFVRLKTGNPIPSSQEVITNTYFPDFVNPTSRGNAELCEWIESMTKELLAQS